MTGVAVVDTNLLLLLVVGSASRDYIVRHKRLQDYTIEDFELLGLIIAEFSEIVLLPHVLAEVSSLARHIDNPAKAKIHNAFRTLISTAIEMPIDSHSGAMRDEFEEVGLTDSVILHLCSLSMNGLNPTLITSDTGLADIAHSLGQSVIDYRQQFQS